jgi:hypothetical protein
MIPPLLSHHRHQWKKFSGEKPSIVWAKRLKETQQITTKKIIMDMQGSQLGNEDEKKLSSVETS